MEHQRIDEQLHTVPSLPNGKPGRGRLPPLYLGMGQDTHGYFTAQTQSVG